MACFYAQASRYFVDLLKNDFDSLGRLLKWWRCIFTRDNEKHRTSFLKSGAFWWSNLFVNLSINTFTTITETPIAYMIENQYAWDFAEKMICEAVDVAEADGTHFSYMEVLDMVHHVCENAGKGYSSMYQDVKRCIPTEIDAINGAIVEQARRYNVSVPYNSLIVDLIHAIEGAYKYRKG